MYSGETKYVLLYNNQFLSMELDQDAFAASVDGMGLQTLEAGETELARLRKLKKERMGDLVRSKRAKIRGEMYSTILIELQAVPGMLHLFTSPLIT